MIIMSEVYCVIHVLSHKCICVFRIYIFFYIYMYAHIYNDCTRHFSNWCDIYKVKKVGEGGS